jgi:predicted ArsR family transcriptional regulator
MAKDYGLTDEQVEQEIERLRQSPLVALARREQRIRYRRRQFLYQLRDLEKKGRALEQAGINMEVLNALSELEDYDDPC